MRHNARYVTTLIIMLSFALRAWAEPTVNIVKQLNGTANDAAGTASAEIEDGWCTLTVTPASGNYVTAEFITAYSTVSGSSANIRTRTPELDNTLIEIVPTDDEEQDPSGETTYTFEMPEDGSNVDVTINFQSRKSVADLTISDISAQTYTGSAIEPRLTVTDGNSPMVLDTDYSVAYSDNTNAGTATATITGRGIYTGTKNKTFTIAAQAITGTGATVTVDANANLVYDGTAKKPGVTVSKTEGAAAQKVFSAETDYDVAYSEGRINVGEYTITVTFKGNYSGTATTTFNISQAAGSISYAKDNVSKTFGEDAFTNAITNTGDGTVSYSSNNTGVATVDAESGLVIIVGAGEATITATVTDGTNYTYDTKTATYTLSVGKATMTVDAADYSGTYDGKAHTITLTAPEGATVKYGTSEKVYELDAAPTYTNVSTNTVYYQVTKANYTTLEGSKTVTITPAAGAISYAETSVSKIFGEAAFTNAITNTGDGTVSYSTSSETVATVDATSGQVTIVGAGTATITATVTDGTNYTYTTKTAAYTLNVATAAMTVTAEGYSGTYDTEEHTINVTAPEDATVMYGTTEGTYDLEAAPAYTKAGTYTVYYQVTKTNYTTVTGSKTVTITPAAATVSFAATTIEKTFGDAAFTTAVTNTGDGTVSYATSSEAVATVDATSGQVTIVGAGTATITATATDGANYTYATKTTSYTLNVATAAMTVTAEGYSGTYDGKAHTISVTAPEGAAVMYGTTEGTYNLQAAPTYTNASTNTVYYQVTKANYTTVTGSKTVTITPAAATISFTETSVSKTFGDAAFANAITNTGDGTISYSTSSQTVATVDATSGQVTIVGAGTTTITATVTDGTNYTYATKTATYTLSVGKATMTVDAADYSGTYDGKAHTITLTAPEGATVKYGTSEKVYELDAAPTYTNVSTNTVYYQVTKANYTTLEGSKTVTITPAAGAISFTEANVSKTFGDAAFTNAITNTGDGTVSYATSSETVATVDATSGQVTIVGAGTATITATATDGANYTYATKTATYTLNVATAAMEVTAEGYSGTYDTEEHTINVTAPEDATVMYGKTEGNYNLEAAPAYTNAGTYTVYYKVTMDNYTPVTGSKAVTITPAAAAISFAAATIEKTFGDAAFTTTVTNTGDGTVSYATSSETVATVDATSGQVTIVGAGTATITATATDGANYTYATKTTSYTLNVATAAMTVDAADYSGTYDGKGHTINVTAPEGAAVKYGTKEGTYDLQAAPTYTNASTNTVYYQVTKTNYTTVTGSKTVTITPAAAAISFTETSVSKTFGDAAFTTAATNTGDGTVSYSSSDTKVATVVDATSGQVKIEGAGIATITATVTDGANYTYATKTATYTLSVGKATMEGLTVSIDNWRVGETASTPSVEGNEGNGAVTYTYAAQGTETFSGTKPTTAGSYTIKVTVAETANYLGGVATAEFTILNRQLTADGLFASGTKYASYYSGTEDIDLGEGIAVHIITGVNGTSVTTTPLSFIPRGIPVLLESITGSPTATETNTTGNMLQYASEATTVARSTGIAYVLYNNMYVRVTDNAIPAGKTYLLVPATSAAAGARQLSISHGNGTAGIESVDASLSSDNGERWFDLQGRRISKPSKTGIYIRDGKKVVIK